MLELAFSARDLSHTRLAVSPMWEVVTSLRTLRSQTVRPLHRRWVVQARPALHELGLLGELVPGAGGYIPDFLNPPAATANPSLDAELAAIAATDPGRIRADLAHFNRWTPAVQALYDDPGAEIGRLIDDIRRYWEAALAPHWARLRGLLEADIAHQARRFAAEGAAAVLRELHPQVRWGDDEVLTLLQSRCGTSGSMAGRGLLLVPSAFVWPSVSLITTKCGTVQLCYPTRGVGALWERQVTPVPDAVAGVLGRSRALLLAELADPASTTELAHRTGLSAAGVSQHLTALRAAGIVSSHRSGRLVLYRRTAIAESLLAAATV